MILLDADGQHPVSLLPEMLEKWKQGADVVYAVRKTRADQSSLHGGLADLFYKLVNLGNRVQIPPHAGDFRLMDRKVVAALNALPGVTCANPGGAFYAFPNISATGFDSRTLQARLLDEAGLAALSGTSFGAQGEGYLRLSYAASLDTLKDAVGRIGDWLARQNTDAETRQAR